MKNRHMIGALIALAPVVAIAQVATMPPVGNAMESGTLGSEIGNATDSTDATDPAMDTNSVDNGAMMDPAANVATETPDPVKPKPQA